MNRPKGRSYADVMSMPVHYRGQNPQGQFLAGNGSPLATDVFASLPEMVERFGHRIDCQDAAMIHSGPWKLGQEAGAARLPFAPGKTPQERLEYGLGYLRGLLGSK